MTTYNKATLKTFFQTGDVPQGGDYANFIDSCLNLVETAEQQMGGNLNTTKLITPTVSATNINATGTISATTVSAAIINVADLFGVGLITGGPTITGSPIFTGAVTLNNGGTVSGTLNTGSIVASNGSSISLVNGDVNVVGRVSANTISNSVQIVSAAGTAQGTAAALTNNVGIYRMQGTVDGTTTGFRLNAPSLGLEQTLIHEGAVSGNLWPNSGCSINALGLNTPFPLVANTPYIVVHKSVSAYAVK